LHLSLAEATRATAKNAYLHLVLLFWNHVLTCASVILSALASVALSVEARYFCLWKRFSSSQICSRENDVRGFFRFGGVRFAYGWPMRRGAAPEEEDSADGSDAAEEEEDSGGRDRPPPPTGSTWYM
jgi:hypothetical protein